MRPLLAAIALLIAAADPAPAPPPTVDVAAAYGADPTWGANPKAIDSAPMIQRALDENPKRVLYLRGGSYYCSRGLVMASMQALVGEASGVGLRVPTVLAFADGSTGITIRDDPHTGGAQSSRVGDLTLWMLYKRVDAPADGVAMLAGARVERCRVTGFKRHGVYIQGQTPANATNLWELHDCQIDTNGGDGVRVEGGDANGGLAMKVSVTGNDGWGIKDNSGLGNTYVATHARTNKAGAYSIGAGGPGLSGVNASTLVGCYAEADNYRSEFGDQVWWFGGTNATSAKGGQLILPGNARARFQSAGGVTPPLSAMGSRLLTGPAFAVSNWAGAPTIAASQDGVLALGLAPGETTPGAGQAQPPRLSIWTQGDSPAIKMGVTRQGYAGPVAEVLASADGAGFGAGYLSLRTAGAAGKPVEALRLQQGRATVGAGGLQLPALSKADRAKLRPAPGLVVFDADARQVTVFDGQSWQAMTGGSR